MQRIKIIMLQINLEQNLALKTILSWLSLHANNMLSIKVFNVLYFESCDNLSEKQSQSIIYLSISICSTFDSVNSERRGLRFARGDIIAKKSSVAWRQVALPYILIAARHESCVLVRAIIFRGWHIHTLYKLSAWTRIEPHRRGIVTTGARVTMN